MIRKEITLTKMLIPWEQELKLAEKLFLPKSMTLKKRQPSSNTGRGSMNNGSRISMRQREKQERALKQKQKEEAAQDHAGK